MEKYIELLNNVAEQLARKVEPRESISIEIKSVERLLSAAECKIREANKAV